jgi:DNA-damage-inducible protein J
MRTMSKSSVVKARIEPELKVEGEAILKSLGLNTTTAITIFFTQLVNSRSFPLELKVPNDETIAAFEEAKNPENLTSYKNVKEAFADVWDSK